MGGGRGGGVINKLVFTVKSTIFIIQNDLAGVFLCYCKGMGNHGISFDKIKLFTIGFFRSLIKNLRSGV